MSIGGQIGCSVSLDELPIENGCSQLHALFSETNGRYLVELAAEDVDAVSAILGQTPHAVMVALAEMKWLLLVVNLRLNIRFQLKPCGQHIYSLFLTKTDSRLRRKIDCPF